jgi:hypothetical protein
MAKKLTALLILSEMDKIHREAKSPSIPPQYIVGTKFSEKNANDIEKAIEKFAIIVGFLAERTKTQGRKMEATYKDTPQGRLTVSKAKFVTSTGRKGSSDMKLLIQGQYITGEIKYGRDTQKADQKKYQEDVERNGGIYVIWKTFEDFLIWYVSRYGRPEIMQQAIDRLRR